MWRWGKDCYNEAMYPWQPIVILINLTFSRERQEWITILALPKSTTCISSNWRSDQTRGADLSSRISRHHIVHGGKVSSPPPTPPGGEQDDRKNICFSLMRVFSKKRGNVTFFLSWFHPPPSDRKMVTLTATRWPCEQRLKGHVWVTCDVPVELSVIFPCELRWLRRMICFSF